MSNIQAGLQLQGYEFIEPIGKGGYSSVWKVRSLKFNRLFVAKVTIVENDTESAWRTFDCEVQALLRLDHPNIICLYAHFRYGDNFVMILEYLPNGSLYDYMRSKGGLRGVFLNQTIKDICSALKHAWSFGVQHRDIKPGNIMFDDRGRAKLVDFGISTTQREDEQRKEVNEFKCSILCASPEIVHKIAHDPVQSDIWALGITILWLVHGSKPWYYESAKELVDMISYGQYIVPKEMDPLVETIVMKMLVLSPQHRRFPSDEELSKLNTGGVMIKPRVRRPSVSKIALSGVFRTPQPFKSSVGRRANGDRSTGRPHVGSTPAAKAWTGHAETGRTVREKVELPEISARASTERDSVDDWSGKQGKRVALGPLSPLFGGAIFVEEDDM